MDHIEITLELSEKIAKISAENPELTYGFIHDCLVAKEEVLNGLVEDYTGVYTSEN